jgi:hypothetical protein
MQRILVLAVIVLSINALAGFAGIGGATTRQASLRAGSVKVLSAVHFTDVSAKPFSVKAGTSSGPGAQVRCPAGTILVSGGYDVYPNALPTPATVTDSSRTGRDTWTVSVDNPSSFPVIVDIFATCARFSSTTVRGA